MPITVRPYIPRYITVHTAPAGQWAENVTVSFPDYIKNVASSEVYPTWNEQALRANILAQISFALNRVYTAYSRSRGYDFDITGSTQNDQKFIKGRNTFENIDRLVDELFSTYIRRRGYVEPLSARFCNGTTVVCDGLSQWGSEELAREGYSYLQILRRYYGDDIELVSGTPIQDVRSPYPGAPLRLGSTGEEVVVLQVMLNRVGRNYPAIGRIEPVDGFFGPETEAAVRQFQAIFNLSADGVAGEATWNKLVMLYVGVADLSELLSEGQPYTDVRFDPKAPVLGEGSSGAEVKAMQYFLAILAQFRYSIPAPAVDGVFGPETRQAVLAFQRQAGLAADGIVGYQTWTRLYADYLGVVRTALGYADMPETTQELRRALQEGTLTYGSGRGGGAS